VGLRRNARFRRHLTLRNWFEAVTQIFHFSAISQGNF
jgi:hypothetical protein